MHINIETVDTKLDYPVHAFDIGITGGEHLWWFPNYAEFGLKGLSSNESQGKSLWRLGPDQVQ